MVANADGRQPDSPPSPQTSIYHRQAALSLVDARGRLPAGRVDDGLLTGDPTAPYGLRLDRGAVVDAFDRLFVDRSVVLVESSDLVRADAYRGYTSPVRKEVMTGQAIHRADRLFARLLEQVDLERDAVLVVGPAHSARAVTLTVLGLRAPGIDAGLLRSATTRRSGFVQLIDVAPTILDLLGIERPRPMEGRAGRGRAAGRLRRRPAGAPRAQRRSRTVPRSPCRRDPDRGRGLRGRARARHLPPVPGAAARVVARVARDRGPLRPRVLPRDVPRPRPAGARLGVRAVLEPRRAPRAASSASATAASAGADLLDALLAALLFPVVLLVVDVVVGTPLQFNSALGYSPTVAGRFIGLLATRRTRSWPRRA